MTLIFGLYVLALIFLILHIAPPSRVPLWVSVLFLIIAGMIQTWGVRL